MNQRAVMLRLIERATEAEGRTRTNPMVGAGFIKDQSLFTSAIHRGFGEAHAEVQLFEQAGEHHPETLFCTLEPCVHHGKTPPCVDRLIRNEISRVVLAHSDPHRAVANTGTKALRRLGVEVEVGVASAAYEWVNRAYFHGARTGFPWIDVKSAVSADGYIAPASGDSRWITGKQSRKRGHELRSRVDAVMVGANTLRRDDPKLTDRVTDRNRQPAAIVVCRDLESLPADAHLFTERPEKTTIVCPPEPPATVTSQFRDRGISLFQGSLEDGLFRWDQILPRLYKRGVGRVLVEGGGYLIGRLLEMEVVNQWHLFYSGHVFGGGTGSAQLSSTVGEVEESPTARLLRTEPLGDDVHVNRLFDRGHADTLIEGHRQWRNYRTGSSERVL